MSTENQASRRTFIAAGTAGAVFSALAKAAAASAPVDDPTFAATRGGSAPQDDLWLKSFQPHARAAAVLFNEFDAGRFERGADR